MVPRSPETSGHRRPVLIRPGQARKRARDLSKAWEEFQSSGTVLPTVRPLIAASWRRAQRLGLSPQMRNSGTDPGWRRISRGQTRQLVLRAAGPIIDRLVDLTQGTPLTLTLADADGVILAQRGERGMLRRGERCGMVVGSRWSEFDAGTNGMGTALYLGDTTQVFAGEHFCEVFHPLVCTASPVRHPLTGQVVAVFDITMPFSEGMHGVWALVTQTAEAIEAAIRTDLTASDHLLLEALTATGSSFAAFAVDLEGRHTIGNRQATDTLGPADHAQLWSVVERTLEAGDREPIPYELADGSRVLVHVRPVVVDDEPVGAVVALRERRERSGGGAETPATWAPFAPAAGWLSAAEAASRSRDPVLVLGEPGAGKSTLVATVHRRRHGGRLIPVECASVRLEDWNAAWTAGEEPAAGVLLRRVDELRPTLQARLLERVERGADGGPWIFATASDQSEEGLRSRGRLRPDLLDRLAANVVTVPPLRERGDEFDVILQSLLIEQGLRRPSLSPDALALLRAYDWPGNVRQLGNVLRRAATRLPNGRIDVRSLPPEIVAHVTADHLTRIEQLEMEAILAALQATGGNVSRAAERLGLSRATVYRRLHAGRVRAAVVQHGAAGGSY